jgi:hypothetical protein
MTAGDSFDVFSSLDRLGSARERTLVLSRGS